MTYDELLTAVQDALAERCPNVTFLRVRSLLDQVLGIVERLVAGLGLLGWFIVAAGLMILSGAVAATALGRRRDHERSPRSARPRPARVAGAERQWNPGPGGQRRRLRRVVGDCLTSCPRLRLILTPP